MLIDAFVMFLSLLGPFEVSFFFKSIFASVQRQQGLDQTGPDQITSLVLPSPRNTWSWFPVSVITPLFAKQIKLIFLLSYIASTAVFLLDLRIWIPLRIYESKKCDRKRKTATFL